MRRQINTLDRLGFQMSDETTSPPLLYFLEDLPGKHGSMHSNELWASQSRYMFLQKNGLYAAQRKRLEIKRLQIQRQANVKARLYAKEQYEKPLEKIKSMNAGQFTKYSLLPPDRLQRQKLVEQCYHKPHRSVPSITLSPTLHSSTNTTQLSPIGLPSINHTPKKPNGADLDVIIDQCEAEESDTASFLNYWDKRLDMSPVSATTATNAKRNFIRGSGSEKKFSFPNRPHMALSP